jgi:hypothetical protein
MTTPPLLNYATAPRPDPVEVHADPIEFHLGLPPVSTGLFVAMLAPYAVLPLLVVGFIGLLSGAGREFLQAMWFCLAGVALGSTLMIVRLSRHRHVERTVGATAGFVYYSDARTAGEPSMLLRRDLVDVRVRRCWWRPWIWELVAVPPRRIFAMTAEVPLEPVVLLLDLSRARLDRIAAGFKQVTPATMSTGTDSEANNE